ncbi:uncharacterized protein LOC127708630 [Mytilus californianus]|uniref:uncharacterized protein LOC127708630 n=1 Tax=Mytilus californianus TaxID=6549 RepID=UPI0022479EFA|nr:uncharacterized protein LOC127708630 [Mytilus californianus]
MEFGNIRQLLAFWGFFSVIFASSNISNDSESHDSNQTYASLGLFDCSFETEDHSGKEQILKFIDEKKELIFIHFHLQNFSNIFPFESGAKIYKMLNLVRTAGGFGNELLRLHPQFEQLSLGTLVFGVEHVDIQLKHMSSECFFNSTEEHVHKNLIAFATKEFRLLENSSSDQRICSIYVDNINGRAEFYYKCCFRNANFSFECSIIEKTFWVNILFFAMTFIYIVAFLYSPLLIPTSWYKKNVATFTFCPSKAISIFLTKEDETSKGDENTDILKNNNIKHMTKLKSYVIKIDKPSCVYLDIKEVKIRLQDTKTASSSFVPGSMFHFLYRTFVECRVKDHEYVKDCCEAKCCLCSEDLKWLSFLQLFVQILFVICLLIPWCLRVLFFYLYEENDRSEREHFANTLNLEYPNVFQWNLTYSLKPDHSFFIMCYVLPFFTFFIKSSIKRVLDKARIDKYAKDINKLFKSGLKNVLKPCTKCGIFGIVICPIYLALIAPYIIIRYILPYIPLVTTSFLLLFSFMLDINEYAQKIFKKKHITKKALLKFTVLLICYILFLLSFATSLILCLEVIVFFSSDSNVCCNRSYTKCFPSCHVRYFCRNSYFLCVQFNKTSSK